MSLNKPIWKLRNWINKDNLDWSELSKNERAIKLLSENPEKINLNNLCLNTEAIEILEQEIQRNSEKINWCRLSSNKGALKLLLENPDKIDWCCLSLNENAIKLLSANLDKTNLYNLIYNSNAFELFKEKFKRNSNKFDYSWLCKSANVIELLDGKESYSFKECYHLSGNTFGIKLLTKNPQIINWSQLSLNPHPLAIKLLSENPNKIYWYNLSSNPSAIELIKDKLESNPMLINYSNLCSNPNAIDLIKDIYHKNPNVIDWKELSQNPAIFELDCEAMALANSEIYEELIKVVMHPLRVFKNPDYDYISELFED